MYIKLVFIVVYNVYFASLKTYGHDMCRKVCEVFIISVILEYVNKFYWKSIVSHFMRIHSVVLELLQADVETEMTKLVDNKVLLQLLIANNTKFYPAF